MEKHRIRLSKTDSVNSVNKDNFVDVNIKRSAKLFPFPDVKDTIDQYEVFKNERDACTKYRLIATINPYCSNVLFNTLTEITKNEGNSSEVEVVTDEEGTYAKIDNEVIEHVKGDETPTRLKMVMNTEYSSENIGYEYHPGYDIFDNHILRNLTFKMVNNGNGNKADFNTISDYLRTMDGENIKIKKRTDIDTISGEFNAHLYLNSDLMRVDDGTAINNNLAEENGWFGFTNNSTVMAKERKDSTWESMDISRVLNNHNSCEFIDMYPDRTLYSFNPKYNKFTHKPEYNWYTCLTYPYKNSKKHPIVSNVDGDGTTNGLKIMSVTYTRGLNDDNVLLIRTYTKHGLAKGDYVYLYYSEDGKNFTKSSRYYKVTNIGDLKKNNQDYYFYLTDLAFLDEDGVSSDNLSSMSFRMRKYYNGVESEYYVRIFRKLPNFKNKRENFVTDTTNKYRLIPDESSCCQCEIDTNVDNYIRNNAYKGDTMIDFDREQYRLAFASTIYTDNSTQIVFTDDIDVDNLVDNLGRPLSEIYFTVVKNNEGYKKWYGIGDNAIPNYTNCEYSHCFGKLTSGFMFHTEEADSADNALYERAKLADVKIINNVGCYDSLNNEDFLKDDMQSLDEIYTYCEYFIGDIAEFIPYKAEEVVLDSCYFRFNTAQRELGSDNKYYGNFTYHEITADDYDLDSFNVEEVTVGDTVNIGGVACDSKTRPEGYYYKPHFKINLREFGDLQQGSHYDISVKSAEPIQMNGIFIKITSSLSSKVSVNDTILICDDSNNIEYTTTVVQVIDKVNFIVNKIDEINWLKLCDILNSEHKFKVRRKNTDIPSYAVKIGNNKFLWRNLNTVSNSNSEEITNRPFANGRLYVDLQVDFFLKRQDKDGKNGLYNKNHFPNDIFGNNETDNIYEYKDDSDIVC